MDVLEGDVFGAVLGFASLEGFSSSDDEDQREAEGKNWTAKELATVRGLYARFRKGVRCYMDFVRGGGGGERQKRKQKKKGTEKVDGDVDDGIGPHSSSRQLLTRLEMNGFYQD